MPARLVVHFSERPARSLRLAEDRPQVLGRDAQCELVIEDDRISRRHARFERVGDAWRLEDLGSKNGTTIEGRPADGGEISNGAWISFGGLLARFAVVSAEQEDAETERDLERLRTSLDGRARFDPAAGLEALLREVLRSILDVSSAERGFVVLTRPEGGLELVASVGVAADDLLDPRFEGSAGAVERALATGRPVTLADASLDTVLGERPSIVEGRVRTLVCLPLFVMDRLLGVVYADSREPGARFSELDVDILSALASHAGLAIGVARLHREVAGIGREMPAAWDRSLPEYRPTGDWRRELDLDMVAGAGALEVGG